MTEDPLPAGGSVREESGGEPVQGSAGELAPRARHDAAYPAPGSPASAGSPGAGDAEEFDAVVLAGGRGSRAGGVDKPGLVVNGRALLASVVQAATAAGAAQVIVVGPERREIAGGGAVAQRLSFVREEPPGSGPVAAVRAGLAKVSAPLVLLLAADLPFLRYRHLQRLLATMSSATPGALLVDDGDEPQWLVSCWRAAVLRRALRCYEGRSLHRLLRPLGPVMLAEVPAPGEPPPWLDCDTPEDLALARRWQHRLEHGAPEEGG